MAAAAVEPGGRERELPPSPPPPSGPAAAHGAPGLHAGGQLVGSADGGVRDEGPDVSQLSLKAHLFAGVVVVEAHSCAVVEAVQGGAWWCAWLGPPQESRGCGLVMHWHVGAPAPTCCCNCCSGCSDMVLVLLQLMHLVQCCSQTHTRAAAAPAPPTVGAWTSPPRGLLLSTSHPTRPG